jgi:hypothetical protein
VKLSALTERRKSDYLKFASWSSQERAVPQWMLISIGIVAGVAVIFGAVFIAVRPYVQAKPPKPRMADPTDGPQDWSASNGWNVPHGGNNLGD